MAKVTIGFGVWLIVVGVYAYVATEMVSWTALIPAIVGVVLAGLGGLALLERFRKHAMHAAAFLALLGFMVTSPGLIGLFAWLAFQSDVQRARTLTNSVMAVTCAAFVILCLLSFVAARRRQAAATEEKREP